MEEKPIDFTIILNLVNILFWGIDKTWILVWSILLASKWKKSLYRIVRILWVLSIIFACSIFVVGAFNNFCMQHFACFASSKDDFYSIPGKIDFRVKVIYNPNTHTNMCVCIWARNRYPFSSFSFLATIRKFYKYFREILIRCSLNVSLSIEDVRN